MFKYKWQMLSGSRIQLDRIYENKVEFIIKRMDLWSIVFNNLPAIY